MTYTMVNGERRRIKPYKTKASYAHDIEGLVACVEILKNKPEYETCEIHQKIVRDYTAKIEVLTEKMDKTRY